MKKKGLLSLLVMLALCLGLFAGYRHRMLGRVNNVQPLRIMVDGTRYVVCGSMESPPESTPDGVITEILDAADYPEKDGQANFGTVGMPYWKIGDEILVEAGRYYLFNES